jgi:hypothetical protein
MTMRPQFCRGGIGEGCVDLVAAYASRRGNEIRMTVTMRFAPLGRTYKSELLDALIEHTFFGSVY